MAGQEVVIWTPPPPAKKRGRPSLYTVELGEDICDRIAEGETLRDICRDEGMPKPMTVSGWCESHPEFLVAYTRARKHQVEAWAAEVREISNTPLMGEEYEETSGSNSFGPVHMTKRSIKEMLGHRRLQVEARVRLIGAVTANEQLRLQTQQARLNRGSADPDDATGNKIVIEGGLPPPQDEEPPESSVDG